MVTPIYELSVSYFPNNGNDAESVFYYPFRTVKEVEDAVSLFINGTFFNKKIELKITVNESS